MSRINVDVIGIVVDDILILSYYTVDTKYDEEYIYWRWLIDDNNITSTVDDQLKHLYKLLNYINYDISWFTVHVRTLVDECLS